MSTIINDIQSVPQTFSSWDSCMSKAYCKWPVIAGIVIASLIVLSIVWCLASCICCGATLCGSCVRCLTCFGCCGLCGDRSRGTRHKDDYSQMPPTPYNGYQAPPAPMSYAQPTQFAQFDAPTKGARIHEDSLPPMPSWETAASRRVEDHSVDAAQGHGQDVEMGRLSQTSPRMNRGGYSQVPLNGPVSPMSPPAQYGHFEGQNFGHGQAQPYASDLGTQRMPQSGNIGRYDEYESTPFSPAPTYTSNSAPLMAGAAPHAYTDRFASGAISPTPRQYNQQQQQQHLQQPYAVSRSQGPYSPPENTRYEADDYTTYRPQSISPPTVGAQEYGYINHVTPAADAIRPPSLLQIGRKPVTGSQREI